ncbi:MAG TPA: PepSY-associated TM helix domain-containing protein [Acidobacteriaceae bacterium]
MEKPARYSLGTRIRRGTAIASRWLHIYLSMVSFAVVFFFAVTGITLNHAEWFSRQVQTKDYRGIIPPTLLHESSDQQPDKLAIVELLRNRHKIHGSVSDFRLEDSQISISFRGPGYAAEAFIDATNGNYDLTETRNGFVAIINDLHKGRDTGSVWSIVIDVSASLLVLVSLTGLVLVCFVYKRRTSGLILAAFAGVLCWLIYVAFVP